MRSILIFIMFFCLLSSAYAASARNQPQATPLSASRAADNIHDFGPDYGPLVTACQEAANLTKSECKLAHERAMGVTDTLGRMAAQKGNGIVNTTSSANSTYSSLISGIAEEGAYCTSVYNNSCKMKCDPSGFSQVKKPTPEEQIKSDAYYKKAQEEMQDDLNDGSQSCLSVVTRYTSDIQSTIQSASATQAGNVGVADAVTGGKKSGSTVKTLLTAAAVGGVAVGGYLLLKGDGGTKEKEENKKNGIITDDDGNEVACFTSENYTRTDCQSALIYVCQGSKADTSGCRSFESAYCAGTGSGTNYCVYAETKVYCAQAGSGISSSPGCVWKNARPSTCADSPEDISCYVSKTADELTTACTNYPNDPLCIAHAAGQVVVQSGSTTVTTSSVASSSVSSASMSSVIGVSTTSSSVSTMNVLSSSTNLFESSQTATQNACKEGQLLNCL